MDAHNLSRAQEAMEAALPHVAGSFTTVGLTVKGVVVNVLYEEGGVLWAVGSSPPADLGDRATMLADSLRVSADEVIDT